MPKQYPRTKTRSAIVGRSRRLILALAIGTVVHLIIAWAPIVHRRFVDPEWPMGEPAIEFTPIPVWSQDRLLFSWCCGVDPTCPLLGDVFEWGDLTMAQYISDDQGATHILITVRRGWPWRSLHSGSDVMQNREFGSFSVGLFDLPWHPRPISFLGNTIVYTSATYALLALTGAPWHRRHKNRCRHCGHHLLTEQTTCPECGRGARAVTSPA